MDPTTPAPQPELRITEPDRIRALAHPVRLDLLTYLDDVGEATATRCAEHLGETVANCSFHLRTLAKAGFIEPAPARGREKPWKPVSTKRHMDISPDQPGSVAAIGELVGLTMLRETERVRSFLRRNPTRPPEWHDTVTVTSDTFWATPDEMRDLIERLLALSEPFAGRSANPALRPEGATIGRLFATVNPDEFTAGPAGTAGPTDEVS